MSVRDDDRSFLYGDGLFETVRVEAKGPVALARHIERFSESAAALGFPSDSRRAGIEALEALREVEPGLWRVTVSRDDPGVDFGGSGCVRIRRRELPRLEPPRLTLVHGLYLPDDSLAEHKTTSWLRQVELRRRARERGFDDAIGISRDGRVGEASAANLFVELGVGRVVTPEVAGILPGTTRARLLDRARQSGLKVEERALREEELREARGIALTSAGVGALAAASLEGRALSPRLAARLTALLKEER